VIPAEFGDRGDDFEQGRVRGGRYPGAYGFQRAMSEPARLLRVDEAAAMLAISGRHLREMIAQQQVRVVRLGRCVRIPRGEVTRLCGADDEASQAAQRRTPGDRLTS
jgi:excisionase family DNA binding protein